MKKIKISLIFILFGGIITQCNNVIAANTGGSYYSLLKKAKKVIVFRPNWVVDNDDFIYNNIVYYLKNNMEIQVEIQYVKFDKRVDNFNGMDILAISMSDDNNLNKYITTNGILFIVIEQTIGYGYMTYHELYFRFYDCDTDVLRSFHFRLPSSYKKYEKLLNKNIKP